MRATYQFQVFRRFGLVSSHGQGFPVTVGRCSETDGPARHFSHLKHWTV